MKENEQLNLMRTFFLISGILNILYALGWSGYTLIGGLITCGLGCLFGAIPVVNVIAAVMDFTSWNRLTKMDRSGIYSTLQFTAVFDIITILTGNVASTAFGIVGIIFLNNDEVKQYLKEKEIY